jgi:multidrug efflux pump subunit AcrA (membrane-fusion protein)
LFGRSRRELQEAQQALADERAARQRLMSDLSQAEAREAELVAERDALVQARDAANKERDGLVQAGDAARAEVADLRRQLAQSQARSPAAEDDGLSGSWTLVLADLERRWAAGVGAQPTIRGVSAGPVAAQLAEGVTREVERLREEMGVDVSLTTGGPIEPNDPVVFLLAATNLLGALAATCERVTVVLDGTLLLTGEVWDDLGDDLEVSRSRALTAGAVVDPIDVDDDQVHITLRP